MASKEDTIKTKLALEGEKEYKTACREINTSLREIGSEMKLVSATYDGNAKSTEALTAKQDVLKKQYEEQAEKVKAAEKALQTMKENGLDETNPAVQKMQTNLNNAQAEMVKTENELKKIDDELSKGKINWEAVGDTVKVVATAIGAAMAALGAAAVAAGKAMYDMAMDAADAGDKIDKSSQMLGLSTQAYQEWDYVLSQNGADIEALKTGLNKLNNTVDDTINGSDSAADKFARLGISMDDLKGKSREEIFDMTIAGLQGISDEGERAAIANDLLGKSAVNLAPLLNQTAEDTQALRDKASDLGMVMSDTAIEAAVAFTDAKDTLQRTFKGIKNSIGSELLPGFTQIADGLTGLIAGQEGAEEAIREGAQSIVDNISGIIPRVLEVVTTMSSAIAKIAPEIISALVTGIVQNLPTLTNAALDIVLALIDGIITAMPQLLEGAVQIIAGLANGISAALPQLVPKIVEVVAAIVQTLIENIPLLIDAALQIIVGLAQGLVAAIPVLIEAIPEIINSLITAILESIPLIIQAGIDLLVALVEALPEIITAIVAAIPEIIDGIITAVIESIPLIIQAGIDLLVALIQALPEIITTIVAALPQIIAAICDALIGNIDKIILAGVQLFVALIENLPTIIVEICKAVPQIIAGLVEAFTSLFPKIIEVGSNLIRGIWDGICAVGDWLKEKVTGFFGGIVDGIKGFLGIKSPSTVFAEIGSDMGAGVGVGFDDEMDGVGNQMQSAVGSAGSMTAMEAVKAVNDGIINNISVLDQAVKAVVERITTGLTAQNQKFNQQGQDIDKHIASGMVSAIPQITGKVPQIVQSIITAFVAQHQKFITEGIDIDKAIASGMVQGIPEITGKVPQIVQPIITALRSFVSDFTAAGEEMVRGIWQGFQNMSSWLESQVRSMMRQIVRAVEQEMQIKSPSRVFAGIGEYMAAGLGQGFADEIRNVEKTIRKATASTVPAVPKPSGRLPRTDRGGVQVVQNIYANETNYAAQQREAAKQFKMIARGVMA